MARKAKHWRKGTRIAVKQGWFEHPRTGVVLGPPVWVEQWWVPVKWNTDDDPDFFKLAGLERIEAGR